MRVEPEVKRADFFFDGQNLFYAAKEAFGHTVANYDPLALAEWVCRTKDWKLRNIYFYTGIHREEENPPLYRYWTTKLLVLKSRGIKTHCRPLTYRQREATLADGSVQTVRIGQEKGVDVHLAVDVLRLAYEAEYDVCVIFSQDQDLTEVVQAVKAVSQSSGRWIKVASAFPMGPMARNSRGIYGTDWIPIDRATYDQCLDRTNYFVPLSRRFELNPK